MMAEQVQCAKCGNVYELGMMLVSGPVPVIHWQASDKRPIPLCEGYKLAGQFVSVDVEPEKPAAVVKTDRKVTVGDKYRWADGQTYQVRGLVDDRVVVRVRDGRRWQYQVLRLRYFTAMQGWELL